MRVLVTGANGALGRGTVRALAAKGHEVLGLVKDPAKADIVTQAGGKAVVGNLEDDKTYDFAKDVDAIVHTAQADYYRKRVTPGLTEKVGALDLKWTRKLIAAGAGRAKVFVYTSTAFVYGDNGDTLVDETTPLHTYRFAGWKVEGEKVALEEAKKAGYASAIVVRPGMVYSEYVERGFFGHGILGPLLNGKPTGYLGKGDQWTSIIHEEDLGALYAAAVEKQPGFTVFNAIDDEPVKHAVYLPVLTQALGSKKAMGFPKLAVFMLMGRYALEVFAGNLRISNKKARAELGWKPKYPTYREGMAAVAAALGQQGLLRKAS